MRVSSGRDVDSTLMRFRMLAVFLAGAASFAFGASAAAVAPKPVAGRCAYGLGVILRPPGLVDVYMYRFAGGGLQRSTQLATANRAGGALGAACTRVKHLTPARTLGLAGPWPLRTESNVHCPEGGTLQIRPILSKGRAIGTRVVLLRKDIVGTTIHVLDGRHVIVDVSLRAKGGGISFDPSYCDRTSIK
jgi:hypothetical protein